MNEQVDSLLGDQNWSNGSVYCIDKAKEGRGNDASEQESWNNELRLKAGWRSETMGKE